MRTEDYEYLYRLEEDFWWFAGMREITAALLDPLLPPSDRSSAENLPVHLVDMLTDSRARLR
jgi:hypothetical protein